MKKLSIILAMAAIVVLATAGSAFANFGPHGGYALDTDACAGCHRAHTSFSDVQWQDAGKNNHSALLVSSASKMKDFCYACHGNDAPGAATNVQAGRYDSGPAGSTGSLTNSSVDTTLNGGGFDTIPTGVLTQISTTSMHDMDLGSITDPMWGAGSSAPVGVNLTCTDCHDPHGSSNYRILKDSVNGVTVGGYVGDVPQPTVFSSEKNYPAGGWEKHSPGAAQMAVYVPNYTSPEYRYAAGANAGDPARSMSTWCSACHQAYDDGVASSYDYKGYESADASRVAGVLKPGAAPMVGARVRHRHKVNVTLGAVKVTGGWGADAVTSTVLPLERTGVVDPDARGTWSTTDYLGCLTCHRAHGTAATMKGWANASMVTTAASVPVTWYPAQISVPTTGGVNPNFSSALLRADNRGVCELCHNK